MKWEIRAVWNEASISGYELVSGGMRCEYRKTLTEILELAIAYYGLKIVLEEIP